MRKYYVSMLLLGWLFFTAQVNAQKKATQDSFVGVWELKQRKLTGQPAFVAVSPGTYKLFTIDGKMQVFQATQVGSFITSYGTYRLLTDSTYEESFTKSIYFPDPKPGTLTYRFSGTDTLYSRYGVPGAYGEEIWKRITYAGSRK